MPQSLPFLFRVLSCLILVFTFYLPLPCAFGLLADEPKIRPIPTNPTGSTSSGELIMSVSLRSSGRSTLTTSCGVTLVLEMSVGRKSETNSAVCNVIAVLVVTECTCVEINESFPRTFRSHLDGSNL